LADPPASAAVEKPDEPVGVGVAVAQKAPEVVCDPWHRPTGMAAELAGLQGLDLRAQLVRDTLVGIQAENPVVSCIVHRELLLRAVPGPVALDHAGAERASNLTCAIRGMRVNDDDLVTEADRAQAGLDPVRLVVSDHARSDAHWWANVQYKQ